MTISLSQGHPTMVIRKEAYERSGIMRAALDERLGLTTEEFRVSGALVCIGPILEEDAMQDLISELEEAGLLYYHDFFELTGNWPEWLELFARSAPDALG